jgi:hypothetical protein
VKGKTGWFAGNRFQHAGAILHGPHPSSCVAAPLSLRLSDPVLACLRTSGANRQARSELETNAAGIDAGNNVGLKARRVRADRGRWRTIT